LGWVRDFHRQDQSAQEAAQARLRAVRDSATYRAE